MGNIMNNIKVFNTTKKFIHKKDIKNIVKYTTEKLKIKNPIINVIIVNNKKIKELNNKYREKNIETDVLSFALEENSDIIYTDFRLLGDIYISIDKAKEQAKIAAKFSFDTIAADNVTATETLKNAGVQFDTNPDIQSFKDKLGGKKYYNQYASESWYDQKIIDQLAK